MTPIISRAEIWEVRFEPSQGAEIAKSRPAIVMTAPGMGRLPLQIVVPITGWQSAFSAYPWMVQIEPDELNRLTKTSEADAFQIKSLSNMRFGERLGRITDDQMKRIAKAVALVIGA